MVRNGSGWKFGVESEVFDFFRERELLLSRFSADRIVGSRRSKK